MAAQVSMKSMKVSGAGQPPGNKLVLVKAAADEAEKYSACLGTLQEYAASGF